MFKPEGWLRESSQYVQNTHAVCRDSTNNNIDLKKENSIWDQEYALIQKVQDQYFCYIVNLYGFNVKVSSTVLCAVPGSVLSSNGHILKRFMLVLPKLQGWIYCEANESWALGPLQGPGKGPSNVFILSYVFEKFTHNQFTEVC